MVEHVLLEQHLAGPALEVAQVELGLAQHDAAGADVLDQLGRQERAPPRNRHQEPGDRRVALLVEEHDQIVDAPEPLAVAVAQRGADDEREVQDGGSGGCGGHARGCYARGTVLTKSPRPAAEFRCQLDGDGPSVLVMDILAIALGVLTFVALLATIDLLDRV